MTHSWFCVFELHILRLINFFSFHLPLALVDNHKSWLFSFLLLPSAHVCTVATVCTCSSPNIKDIVIIFKVTTLKVINFPFCNSHCLCDYIFPPVITRRGPADPAVWTRHPPQTHPLCHGEHIHVLLCSDVTVQLFSLKSVIF